MTASKHSPGPWQIQQPPDEYTLIRDADGNHVCGDLDRLPNTRLVVVAPELLSACKLALQVLELEYPEGYVVNILQRAIAKTQGEDS